TLGDYNTASGSGALQSNTTGSDNSASGAGALFSNTTGYANAASGYQALYSNVGDSAEDGWYNTAAGYQALYNNNDTSGNGGAALNTATGFWALYSNTAGSYNTASGVDALDGNTTGSYNTAVGMVALFRNNTGNYLTCIGYECDVTGDGLTNATAIGAAAVVGESNALVLGCNMQTNSDCQGTVSVGIGTSSPDNLLTVNGSADKPGGGSWGTYSDRRLKTLSGSFNSGLRQILRLHPVRYHYNKENALGIRDEQEHVGLVAQDVQAVIPEAVTENSKGYLLLNNDPILWSMLNAIKE